MSLWSTHCGTVAYLRQLQCQGSTGRCPRNPRRCAPPASARALSRGLDRVQEQVQASYRAAHTLPGDGHTHIGTGAAA